MYFFFLSGFSFLLTYFSFSFLFIFGIFSYTYSSLIIKQVILIIVYILGLILTAAFLTLFERQVLGSIQHRKGPNIVGFLGLVQPIADAVKLLIKEPLIPKKADIILFLSSSLLIIILSLLLWVVLPFNGQIAFVDLNISLLYIFSISSLGIYGTIIAGWASNSRYAFLGSLRACAQMLSYELVLSMIIFLIFICTGSFNIISILEVQSKSFNSWFGILFWPLFFLFFICAIAETNRAPFDLPEAESESVSGYNIDYSSIIFAFFFLAEYLHILFLSNLMVCLFLGGWSPLLSNLNFIPGSFWYLIKLTFIYFAFIWVRGSLPRFRYDQLMVFGWKFLLPFVLGLVLWYLIIINLNYFILTLF